ncbi:MAG: class I SAM-dependent methyltransferase [Novipirellula sp. JB048]
MKEENMRLHNYFLKDCKSILGQPSQLLRLRHKEVRHRLIQRMKARAFQSRISGQWETDEIDSFQHRHYESYEQYLEHQKYKLRTLNLSDYDHSFHETLRARLENSEAVHPGDRVVCLAARLGSEVKAFIDNGCFAVGIDLNPGPENKYVVTGDFHNLQFADNSVDVIYSNALDHAFDIKKIVTESRRVLCPGGLFIIEAVLGTEGGYSPQSYESFWWQSCDDLIQFFVDQKFELVGKEEFLLPWKGMQMQLVTPSPVSVSKK